MIDDADEPGLDAAYALETPDDSRRLYATWAATYEDDFVAARGYEYHRGVADLFVAGARPEGPVLDVGCGTGVVGLALAERGVALIDGVDISPEMLGQAATKDVYRLLIEADLTVGTGLADDTYAGLTSSGTFTHGHLSPEPLAELIRITMPAGRCAIGVNTAHFAELGFEAWFDAAVRDGRIDPYVVHRIKVYADSDPAIDDQMSDVVVFTVR